MSFLPRLIALLCLISVAAIAEDAPDCIIQNHCIEDQFLRIDLNDMRIRNFIVNIGATYTNLEEESVDLSIYSIYLIATSANGERIELSTTRRHIFLGDNYAQHREAFSLKFNEPIGGELDLIFVFENPDSRYAFLGLRPEDFTDAPDLF